MFEFSCFLFDSICHVFRHDVRRYFPDPRVFTDKRTCRNGKRPFDTFRQSHTAVFFRIGRIAGLHEVMIVCPCPTAHFLGRRKILTDGSAVILETGIGKAAGKNDRRTTNPA